VFDNVSIVALHSVDAPHRIASTAIMARLRPTLSRLGIQVDLLGDVAGVKARRFWDAGVQPSAVAAQAGEAALQALGVDRSRVGVLLNTSVCRDYLEPSTASLVHGRLGLSPTCPSFDIGNACLGFLSGMDVAAMMIESGRVEYALVVDGEGSRSITEATVKRLLDPATTEQDLHSQLASLTLGSGAVAMVLGRADRHPEGHRYLGGVSLAATQHSHLCAGEADRMLTDGRQLLVHGVELAGRTWALAEEALGWRPESLDLLAMHQVSRVHTATLCTSLGLDHDKVFAIYPEFGNVGPASVPMVLSKAAAAGRVQRGDRVALMGIGSGLNCAMAEVVW
jgi:3-oxoacyl-[acyl-carrier-protein] synthase-3